MADVAPSEGALDHLRKAVPARRARKRQAVVGLAAAVVLIGTAVPAFVHVAGSGGLSSDDRPVNAGHGQEAQGGTGEGEEPEKDDAGKQPGRPTAGPSASTSVAPGEQKPDETASGIGGGTADASVAPSDSAAVSIPVCAADQLGVVSAQADKPDAEGKVYGTFRISNISGIECAVSGEGKVDFEAKGAANSAKISVVAHAAGDAATGLPDPSQETRTLVLRPDTAYEVKFAWVPTETCPTVNPSPDPSTPTDAGGTSTGSTGSTGSDAGSTATNTAPQLGTEDGTPQDGSVAVTHTAEPGAPSAETTIPNACAGTIYRTGVLDAS
ncbi:hypothetical protein [Streptomyces purpureus]|uniref:hypothetical protein n=1 Tax=Streptomyces purpureus TaxID=1951 RepID=UPI0003634E44|nr:hypothetical protein [Streptomyces purpureus]